MKHFGVSATARASIYLYNTRDDVDRLVSLLHDARPTGAPATRLFLKESQRIIALDLEQVLGALETAG